MTDLTTTPSSPPAKTTSPAMSEALTLRLDSTTLSADNAALQIADDPGLLAEARASLPALRAVAERKAGVDGVKAVIGRRFALHPQPPRNEAEAAAWWADYFDLLADVPLASLEAGMRAHVADPDSEFMPKPGRLKELAFTTPSRSLQRYYRAKQAVALADQPAPGQGPRVDPAEVEAILSDYRLRSGWIEPKRPELPSIAGKTDERGVTPQMRELMARREAERGL